VLRHAAPRSLTYPRTRATMSVSYRIIR
jgi:hypothetical protein